MLGLDKYSFFFFLWTFRPPASQSTNESFGEVGGENDSHSDSYGDSSQDNTLMMREVSTDSERRVLPCRAALVWVPSTVTLTP